jgi:NAD(P)-dependent dehydrogenase (short-subunit alcohol dehydrogenase family)
MAEGSLAGRVALVTGANTGIGKVTALELARRGARVIVGVRSVEKAVPLLEESRAALGRDAIDALPLDLADFASIRTFATEVLARAESLHLLINNAGLAGTRAMSKSGFELTFGVNHMGTFLLTSLLLDRVVRSSKDSSNPAAHSRIVTVASKAHYKCNDFTLAHVRERTRSVTGVPEYNHSKLANILFSAELARRLAGTGVTTYSLHPGVVATDVWRSVPWPFRSVIKLGMITPEQGALTTLHCATSAEAGAQTGLYYDSQKVKEPSKLAQDKQLAAELWAQSEKWIA